MKKVLFIISLLIMFPIIAESAAPTRSYTYTAGNTIQPNEVTTNEDNIYTYLQNGIDVIANNAVTTTKIADSAVTTAKIADSNVTTAKIADNTVTSAKLDNTASLVVSGLTVGGFSATTYFDTDVSGLVVSGRFYDGYGSLGTSGQFLQTQSQGASSNVRWTTAGDMLYSDSRFKIISFTRDTSLSSGNQEITGVGFKPKVVIFYSNENTTRELSLGFDDGITAGEIHDYQNVSGAYANSAFSIFDEVTTTSTLYSGVVSSFNSDGCTITWTKTGSPTGTLTVLALFIR